MIIRRRVHSLSCLFNRSCFFGFLFFSCGWSCCCCCCCCCSSCSYRCGSLLFFFPGEVQVSLSLLRSQQNCMSLLRIFHQVMQSLRRLWRSHGVSVMSREDPPRCQVCRCSFRSFGVTRCRHETKHGVTGWAAGPWDKDPRRTEQGKQRE